ncbi:mite group 2 allergen-like Ixo r 2 [Amblyomma americanum]
MIRCVLLVLIIGLASAQRRDLDFWDCGSTAKVVSVQVEPCDSDPCVLKRGEKSKVHFSIISDQDTTTAWLYGKMKLWIIPVKIPGVQRDLCKSVLQCPIAKGEKYGGSVSVTVPSAAPQMTTTVTLQIYGDEGSSVCIRSYLTIA